MAVQVDTVKFVLKAPGTKRLILKYDEPLSSFAFKFNLRRDNMGHRVLASRRCCSPCLSIRARFNGDDDPGPLVGRAGCPNPKP